MSNGNFVERLTPIRALICVVVFLLVLYVSLLSATFVIGLISPDLFKSLGLYSTCLSEILLLFFVVATTLIFFRSNTSDFVRTMGLKRNNAPAQVLAGFVFGVVLVGTMFGVMTLSGGFSILRSNGLIDFVPYLFLYLVAGFTEELIFRGFVFYVLEKAGGTVFAIIFSSLAFGFAHLLNMPQDASLPYVIYACLLLSFEAGLPLSGAYLLTRSLWLPTGLHWAWNFLEGTVFGAAVSGTDPGPTFFTSRVHGSYLVNGGVFGPEASLPFFIVGCASGLALLHLAYRKGSWSLTRGKDIARASPIDP